MFQVRSCPAIARPARQAAQRLPPLRKRSGISAGRGVFGQGLDGAHASLDESKQLASGNSARQPRQARQCQPIEVRLIAIRIVVPQRGASKEPADLVVDPLRPETGQPVDQSGLLVGRGAVGVARSIRIEVRVKLRENGLRVKGVSEGQTFGAVDLDW